MDSIEKYVKSLDWITVALSGMDDMLDPVMGVRDWDDAVCVDFKGRMVASIDGPYTMRLVLKSALVHAATDVVVKGARPVFALDTLVGSKPDLEAMIESLRIQAEALKIPLIGGNTLFEDSEARCSIAVIGELVIKNPIRDSGAKTGDIICLFGEPLWGERKERMDKAKILFDAWFTALVKVEINSAKDVTKGGLVSVVYEMEEKSGRKFWLNEKLPYPLARNLDNFIVTLDAGEFKKLESIALKKKCRIEKIGVVE
ncbi:MAG: AIR synthase related protein [Candidatus Altiarchaeota archaeon]|nr:AIR synthase related protein [Candidatus Altiarchaeota archaeon]